MNLKKKYEEEQNVGVLGAVLLGRRVPTLKIPDQNINIENSSDILRYIYAINKSDAIIEKFLNPSEEVIYVFLAV